MLRFEQHQNGEGAQYTKSRLPVVLLYSEEYDRVDKAFYREKIVEKWSRAKKEALMSGNIKDLNSAAQCKNHSHFKNRKK